jgi:hypothetical protein
MLRNASRHAEAVTCVTMEFVFPNATHLACKVKFAMNPGNAIRR